MSQVTRDKLNRVISVRKELCKDNEGKPVTYDVVESIEYVGDTLVPQKIVFGKERSIERQESGHYVLISQYVQSEPPKSEGITNLSVSQRRGAVYWVGKDPYKSGQSGLQFVDADDKTPSAKDQGAAVFIALVFLLVPGMNIITGIIGALMLAGIIVAEKKRALRLKRKRFIDAAWEKITFSRSMREGLA